MPALEITPAEWSHHIAMLSRTHEVRRKLRGPIPPARPAAPIAVRRKVEPPPVASEALPPRHPLDAVLYAFPLWLPAYVPKDAPPEFNPNRPKLFPKDIIAECARLAGVSPDDIRGKNRALPTTRARQYAAWRIHHECKPRSLGKIGQDLGGRDHSTVLHAIRHVQALIDRGVINPGNPVAWFFSGYMTGNGK